MKIFISGINTQLGYHLTETLRQDHVLLEGYSLISGTLSQTQPYMLHDSVDQTFEFSKERDIAVKNAAQSDVLIMDIRNNPGPQIQFILKVLKHYPIKNPIKVIGISNYMTWSNTKTTQFSQIPHDKELLLQCSLNKQHWRTSQLKQQQYPLRVPHPMFVYNYLLEEQVMQLKNSQSLIQPVILCTGVLYGRSGLDLKQQLECALEGTESYILSLSGDNMINSDNMLPVLHADKLMKQIEGLVYPSLENPLQNVQEYKILCQEDPKPIVRVAEMLNQEFGNMKQLNQLTKNTVKQEKSIDRLNIPLNTQEHQRSTQHINESSTRVVTPLQSINRNSSSQSNTLLIEINPNTQIPQLTYANHKKKFSLLTNIKFSLQSKVHSIIEKQLNQTKTHDNQISIQNQQNQALETKTEPIKTLQNDQLTQNWIKKIITDFLEYYEVEFKHFIISEQLLNQISQSQPNDNPITHSILTRYFLINKKTLSQQLDTLIQSGIINRQRLATPQEDKKKPTNKNPQSRQSNRNEASQYVFPQVIKHLLQRKKHSNFILCLKHDQITKMITLFNQPGFEELKDLKFINLTVNQIGPHTPAQSWNSINDNFEKSVQIYSDEFYTLFGIQNHKVQSTLLTEKVQLDDKEAQNSKQKTRKMIQGPKQNCEESQELKINLLSQYLLDNLIVYLAQAKQQLKLKGKLKIGQKFEGKQNIEFFIQELRDIKRRQILLANEQQQEQI